MKLFKLERGFARGAIFKYDLLFFATIRSFIRTTTFCGISQDKVWFSLLGIKSDLKRSYVPIECGPVQT